MITCEAFYQEAKKHDLLFYAGVPDSTFKEWLQFLANPPSDVQHIAVSNECDAIALMSGYYMASHRIGVAYMQNSGLGNAVNPLTSLADKEVYAVPMLLMIGWRGMPGMKDEPQHKKMGRITLPMLDTLEIPYSVISEKTQDLPNIFQKACDWMQQKSAPYAMIIEHGTFAPYTGAQATSNQWPLSREDAIKLVVSFLQGNEAIVSTTGKISRELYEYRDALQQSHSKDFYTVGSLGCSVSIAMGIALAQPKRQVVVFDADGSALMHLGSWATVGAYHPQNLKHIIFDNETYESTGAQASNSKNVQFNKIALATGYAHAVEAYNEEQLRKTLPEFLAQPGPNLLLIKVKSGSRANLGRPKTTTFENKEGFMQYLSQPLA